MPIRRGPRRGLVGPGVARRAPWLIQLRLRPGHDVRQVTPGVRGAGRHQCEEAPLPPAWRSSPRVAACRVSRRYRKGGRLMVGRSPRGRRAVGSAAEQRAFRSHAKAWGEL